MSLRTLFAALAALALLSPATAAAETPPPPGLPKVIGLEVKAVDAAAKTVTGIQHCAPPDVAGQVRTFYAALSDFTPEQFPVGQIVGIEVDWTREPAAITRFGPAPCPAQPAGPQPGEAPWPGPGPGPGNGPIDGGPRPGGEHSGPPQLNGAFTSRVWKFEGEADGFAGGILSMTLGKILNLPKRMASQDDELVDQDTAVIVDDATRVYDGKKPIKQRAEASLLADAESVRVQGKLLRPAKWRKDEDGEPVTTIRAKKIYVLD